MSEKVVLKVSGMSCGHCEMAVKKALMAVPGVADAAADHKAGSAQVQGAGLSRDALVAAVKNAGYEAA